MKWCTFEEDYPLQDKDILVWDTESDMIISDIFHLFQGFDGKYVLTCEEYSVYFTPEDKWIYLDDLKNIG